MSKKLKKFEGCNNMFGPISDDIKSRLLAFFENPTPETWADVHTIIIGADGWTTFWQAVIHADPSFPKSASMDQETYKIIWDTCPDFFTARRALEYARGINCKKEE